MSYIESAKSYTGSELEKIFFRPILSGATAAELGVRVLYNMPMPTTVNLWGGNNNILQKYTSSGWSGSAKATREQKTIAMNRVKAEQGFAASDYFSMVFESLAMRQGLNMDDLSGTELESAETEFFRQSIAESIRSTMWVGDTSRAQSAGHTTFDGFLTLLDRYVTAGTISKSTYEDEDIATSGFVVSLFDELFDSADVKLRDVKGEGQLAYFVTSDIYNLYEKYLDSKGVDSAYVDSQSGRQGLMYHGIPVIDIHVNGYLNDLSLTESLAILTDRRNLVMAVNTSDFPGAEIKMWYNPDLMENRQRATFMIGCEILDHDLVSYAHYKA